MFLNGFLSNSSPSNGLPVFGLMGGSMGFFTPPAPNIHNVNLIELIWQIRERSKMIREEKNCL